MSKNKIIIRTLLSISIIIAGAILMFNGKKDINSYNLKSINLFAEGETERGVQNYIVANRSNTNGHGILNNPFSRLYRILYGKR